MISTEVLCAATSELGNSSSYSVCTVSSLVRASDWNSEDPGSNPGCISISFFTVMLLCFACCNFDTFKWSYLGESCSSNTRFTPLFASWVATALIPVSLWLGSHVVGLKYWYSSWKKTSFWKKMELVLPPSLLLYYTRPKTSITSARFSLNS